MIEVIQKYIESYRSKGAIVDGNLLLLYIGHISPEFIGKFKRTRTYATEDYHTLTDFLKNFKTVVTTPNILTEVGNLANSLSGNYRFAFEEIFSEGIKVLSEEYLLLTDD